MRFCAAYTLLSLGVNAVYANSIVISGKIYSENNNAPIEFGTVVIPEAKFKSRVQADGRYAMSVPNAGTYTIIITSPGLKTIQEKITITKSTTRDFRMELPIVKTRTVRLRAERDIQKLGRNTLSVEQLKETRNIRRRVKRTGYATRRR
ncbi:MAG TPA: carboxypeptidase-like regulatory domain-containing protein [Turneriella sp.]|nr:carboxypeptidase-like regulatory domain-containing protein [Turneriella sp.]